MIIQHNIAALNSHRQLGINNSATSKNLEKLSSGYRINRAGDDAAGLAISEKMRGQIRGLAMAEQNTENGISLIQTAEGGLQETHAILQRMRELAVQSANGTYDNDVDRYNLNKEVDALKSEINRIASSTHYNGINLLDGSMTAIAKGDDGAAECTTALNTSGLKVEWEAGTTYGETYKNTAAVFIIREDGTAALQIGTDVFNLNAAGEILANDGLGTTKIGDTGWTGMAAATTAGTTGFVKFVLDGDGKFSYAQNDYGIAKHYDRNAGNSARYFQIGANGTADQRVASYVDNMGTGFLGLIGTTAADSKFIHDISIATQDKANEAIEVIDAAINRVSSTRSDLGALQNRLEHTLNNLGVTKENLTAAESTIRDVDMAKEMMEYTKNTILVQASQAMLAQAQQLPQGVLQLLR